MKSVKIGVIGYGTIGKGLHDLIEANATLIEARTGVSLSIGKICEIDRNAVKHLDGTIPLTDSWQEVTADPGIDCVVELIGGIEPAKSIVLDAIKNRKYVVTANKKLLAEEGSDIFAAVDSAGLRLGFEAAIGGGIPCLLGLTAGMVGNNIRSIMGILNGTTNYILSQMDESGLPFDTILKDAQKKGFAEADPTFDIEGYDAGHKIALLAMMAYHRKVDYSAIPIEGITRISDIDISYAHDMGYCIKLLGIARMTGEKLDISVHPTMIPLDHPLAAVRNEFNAVMYDGDMTDPVTLFGKGAGSLPTASAVVSDIVQAALAEGGSPVPLSISEEIEFSAPEDRISKFYLRIHSKDAPGILSKISGVLGKHEISIASVIQKETEEDYVPLIIMAHEVDEAAILNAAEEIGNFDFVKGDVIILRVED